MPVTVSHALSATTPNDPTYEIRPEHWNSNHIATISAVGSEIFGAFSNENNVSFSTNGAGFIVASANVTAAPSPVNVTGDNGSSVNAQTIAFRNSNGVTFGVSTAANGASITASHNGLTTARASNDAIGLNTALTANGVSVTANSSGLSLNFPAFLTTAALSNHSHGFSAAGGSSAFQTLSFSNGGGVSFTNTNGQVGATVATTYRASNDAIGLNSAVSNVTATINSSGLSLDARGYAGTGTTFNGANVSGSLTQNSNGIQMSLSVAAPGGGGNFSAGVSGGNTSGDTGITGTRVVFAGGNNITLSQATDANGATITVSGANAGGAQTGISGIVVSNTTYTSGTVSFSNANGITFGSSAGQAITASHNGLTSQSNQNVTAGNGGFAFQTLSFSNVNGISFGTSAGSAITASHNALTTARASTDAIGLNTAQTNVTWTVNSAGLSFNAAGYGGTTTAITGAASITLNSGGLQFNGAGLAGTSTGFAGANISGSITHNTAGINLSLSVAAPGAAAENNAINLLGANTAGNTTATGSTIGWSGVNLTLSGTNASQVVISAPATSSLVGSRGISISTAGSTISVMGEMVSTWFHPPSNLTTVGAPIVNSASIVFLPMFQNVSGTRLDLGASVNVASTTNTSSGAVLYSLTAVLLTKNGNTLNSVSSATTASEMRWQSNSTASVTGAFFLSVPMNIVATPGNYWGAFQLSTRATGATGAATTSLANTFTMVGVGSAQFGAFSFREPGAGSSSSQGWISAQGMYSSTGNLSAISVSAISQVGTLGNRAAVAVRIIN